jgi:hypothetical protein
LFEFASPSAEQPGQQPNRPVLWKAIAVVVFGLLLSVPGLAQAQYSFTTIDVPGSKATAANGNSMHEIVGEFDDADGNTHGFVLNKR